MRELELRLLRTTLPPDISTSSLSPLVQSLLSSIENGNYADVAATSASYLPLGFGATWKFEDSTECASRFYEELKRRIRGFVEGLDGESEERLAVLLCVGVAAVLAFTQQNLTGQACWKIFSISCTNWRGSINRRQMGFVGCKSALICWFKYSS